MKLLVLSALLSAIALAASNQKFEQLKRDFPKEPEVHLLAAILERLEKNGVKYEQIAQKHKTFKDFNDVLAELKKVDPEGHAKIEPLYQKCREAYLKLTDKGKAFMQEYFNYIWSNIVDASLHKVDLPGFLTKEQGPTLKQKYGALGADKILSKIQFPMLITYLE